MSFHFVGSSAPFNDSQPLLLPFVVVAVDLVPRSVCALSRRRNIVSLVGAAAPRAKADTDANVGEPPDISKKIGRKWTKMDGE